MSAGERQSRREQRRYKRVPVRYGAPDPKHRGVGMQVSSRGLFISTNAVVYEKGSPIVLEIGSPGQSWTVPAVVRHAYRVHPSFAPYTRPGMGVELLAVPPELKAFLTAR